MYDPASAYRSTQVMTSGPAAQIVLLYQGAIRFGTQHIAALEQHDLGAANDASLRCQAIVAAMRESLDPAAGPIAAQLEAIYEFCLARLADGNIRKDAQPTREAVGLLRDLLGAWQEIARNPLHPSSALPHHAAPVPVMAP